MLLKIAFVYKIHSAGICIDEVCCIHIGTYMYVLCTVCKNTSSIILLLCTNTNFFKDKNYICMYPKMAISSRYFISCASNISRSNRLG